MADDLPANYDLIVVGTGLSESIVASAAARIGKQVLHIDHRDYYGGNWASFSFSALQEFLSKKNKFVSEHSEPTNLQSLSLNYSVETITNVEEQWSIPDDIPLQKEIQVPEQAETNSMQDAVSEPSAELPSPESTSTEEQTVDASSNVQQPSKVLPPKPETVWTKKEILKNSRRFNLDLAPKVLYARGEMVDLLITSGICRYAEFRNIANIYTYDVNNKCIISVPCSRSDVFSSSELSMVEKRLLMKTLSFCADYEKSPEAYEEFQAKTFGQFLDSKQIRGRVRQYVMDTVAMANESTDFRSGVENVQKFIRSIGRYGNTPFLWTLYGSGELPQCFCRLCAVFGGLYCLKRAAQQILFDDSHKVLGILSENQTLKAPVVFLENSLVPNAKVKGGISRAILITDRSLVSGDVAMLLNFPSLEGHGQVRILELPPSSMACPVGLYVVHLQTPQVNTATEDLRHVISLLFNFSESESRPKILWSLHFNLLEFECESDNTSSVYYASGPNGELDFDNYVIQAKNIFSSMFPDEEFLPKVPDPEDVIIEDVPDPNESVSEETHPETDKIPQDEQMTE